MTTTEFTGMHALISQILADNKDAEPRAIAEAVAELIPDAMRKEILITALMPTVRTMIGKQRNTALSGVFTPPPAAPPRAPVFRPEDMPPPSAPTSIQAERAAPRRSPKVEQIRDWWAEMLEAKIHIGASRWKPLGMCDVHDLEFAESERRKHAEKETAAAKKYLALRQLLDKYKVAIVADLPPEARRELAQ